MQYGPPEHQANFRPDARLLGERTVGALPTAIMKATTKTNFH